MSISDRLNQIVDFLGIKPNAFAMKIGISQPRLNNYLKGRDPDYDTLRRICETFVMIDPGWLLTGRGTMLVDRDEPHTPTSGNRIDELTRIIETQAKALFEQQRFINAHFPQGHASPPRPGTEEWPEDENRKSQ